MELTHANIAEQPCDVAQEAAETIARLGVLSFFVQ